MCACICIYLHTHILTDIYLMYTKKHIVCVMCMCIDIKMCVFAYCIIITVIKTKF